MTLEELKYELNSIYDIDTSSLTLETPLESICPLYPLDEIKLDLWEIVQDYADVAIHPETPDTWITLQDVLNATL